MTTLVHRVFSKKIIRSHIWQSLANYTNTGFALVIGVLLARILTPHDFGVFGSASALVALCFIPANWSLGQVVLADPGHDRQLFLECLKFAWGILLLKCLITTILVTTLWTLGASETAAVAAFVGFAGAFTEIMSIHRARCEALGVFKINFYNALLSAALGLGAGVPLALAGAGSLSLALPLPIMICWQLIIYPKTSGMPTFPPPQLPFPWQHAGKGFLVWLISACDQALARADKLAVASFQGESALGLYSRAYNYAPISHLALQSLVGSPTIATLANTSNQSLRCKLLARSAIILVAAGIINWLLVILLAEPLVPLVFGHQWNDAIPYFKAFAGLSLALGITGLPATILLSQKRYMLLATIRLSFTILILASFLTCLLLNHPLAAPHTIVFGLILQGLTLTSFVFKYFRSSTSPKEIFLNH